jgi:phage head maturation protease
MSESDEQRAEQALDIMRRADSARIETKAEIPSAVLDVAGRDVSILFSVDTLDRVGDITSPKAFNRSIGLGVDRIAHLFMHDDRQPAIGRIMTIETVTRRDLPADVQAAHPEATGGAVAVSRLLKAGRGAEVLEGIREGIPYGASFGFITKKSTNHPTIRRPDGRPARWLEEVHLLEVTTALPGAAVNLATRSRLGKALELLAEMKAGARHSANDVDLLNEIAALVLSLGATNITAVLSDPAQAATPRTSAIDALLHDIGSLYEVA